MLTRHIYRPTMNSGSVYARLAGTATPMQSIGGVQVLEFSVEEDVKKQPDYSRPGGGTRAQVNRISSVLMKATLQDLNPVNLARVVFGNTSEVATATITDENHTAYLGGLIALAHINPTTVTVKVGADAGSATAVDAATNYEVRPEGVFILDDAEDLDDEDNVYVSYTHGAYDLVQALTNTAPELELRYAGINEAMNGLPSIVDVFRVKMSATKGWGLINDDFAVLEVEGEVLLDPTKTGEGISKFFLAQFAQPA